MTYSEEITGITDLRNAVSMLHNICRDFENAYDPLMAVDEITKVIFVKLSEERSGQDGGTNRFSTKMMKQACHGAPLTESEWLNQLFRDNIKKKSIIFPYEDDDKVNLSDESSEKIVNVLSNFVLSDQDVDTKGVAYEELLSTVFRDSLGQYFTPRKVVEFMVKLIDPSIDEDGGSIDRVIDPGVGSGGFLISTIEHYLESSPDAIDLHKRIPDHLYGIDRSPRMSKIATTNLMLHGKENWEAFSHIYQGDSLRKDTNKGVIQLSAHNDKEGEVSFGEFDKLLANPPFGSKARKELAEEVTKNASHSVNDDLLETHRETEALFLKRSVELLRPGGELAIVIPKNIIKGKSHADLQNWLRENTIIKSVISLPLSTFQPFGSDIKTVVLHAQKRDNTLSQGTVYFDAARYVGHDSNGSTIPENDLRAIAESYQAGQDGQTARDDSSTSKSFGVFVSSNTFASHFDEGGLDPLYYILENDSINNQIEYGLHEGKNKGSYELETLKNLTTRRTSKINRTDASVAYVIFASDIDRPLGKVTSLTVEDSGTDGNLGSYTTCEPGNVIYYRMRPYLRKAAVVPESVTLESGEEVDLNEVPLACSPEFCVLSVDLTDPGKIASYGDDYISPEYLWLILRSNLVLYQVLPTIKGGTRPRVPFDAIMSLEIPMPSQSVQEDAIDQYRRLQQEINAYRQTRQETIDLFKRQHGNELFNQLEMNTMRQLDDDLISLLIEADILPKSYHGEFY